MNRRHFTLSTLAILSTSPVWALSLNDLTSSQATSGLKTALEKGAVTAIALLGKTDGFLGNPQVRIPLPGGLDKAGKLLSNLGQGQRVEELITAMNRAAEAAVPMAKDLMVNAIRNMSVTDAKNILTGGETSATTFFSDKTREPLSTKFLPVVTKATKKVGLAEKYNHFAGKVANFGLIQPQDANIERYVTGKALDGLFFMMGEEEKKIRKDPVGTGSAILQKVFGALK